MFLLLIIAVITVFFILWYKNNRILPDGPVGFPIIGYYPFLVSNTIVTIQKLCAKYPDIMRIKLLGEEFYFLNSMESIKEALEKQGEVFSGRPGTEFYFIGSIYGKKGIITSEGEIWNIQTKFYIRKLCGSGMGKSDFGYKIHDACDNLISYLNQQEEIENLSMYLTNYVSNVITLILYGKKYRIEDPTYQKLITSVKQLMGTGSDLYFYLTGPLLKFLVSIQQPVWNKFQASKENMFNFFHDQIKDRMESKFESEREFNDVLDCIIEESKGLNYHLFDEKTVARNFLGMFIAGTETNTSTLNFACNLMASHQEIQHRVFKEIVDIFGKDYKIMINEMVKLHYARAVIAEIQRYVCIVPLGFTHVNKEPATICGYRFPRRSKFIPNIERVARDKRYFKNPFEFDPNNFLDENGNYVPNPANIPFGIGKRKCLGYKLAEMELFIGFTRLIQEFEWLPPKGEKIKYEVNDSLVRYLSPFKIVAKKRQ